VDEIFFNKRRDLHQAYNLRLPPPARGRSGEFDGGPAPIEGAGEDLSAARYGFSFDLFRLPSSAMAAMIGAVNRKSNCIRKPWRLEAAYSSSTSAASERRSSSMAQLKPSKKPARDSGDISTSSGRPFSRSATAFNASTGASGLVPAPVLDGGRQASGSSVEKEGDSIAFANLSGGSFLQLLGIYVLFFHFMGSFM
jgi:hypothetical protein